MTERGEKRVADRPSAVIPGEHCETRDPLAGLLAETVGSDCSGGYGHLITGALGTSGSRLCAALGRDDLGDVNGTVAGSRAKQIKTEGPPHPPLSSRT